MKKLKIILIGIFIFNFLVLFGQTVTDSEGNIYNIVVIGNQEWMAENLKATQFSNQDPIPLVLDNTLWSTQTQGAYCYYDGNISNFDEYGLLYNWNVVKDNRNVCPTGYHVPLVSEWEELITFLGGNAVAGGKLKEVGFAHWLTPNTSADNSSGFTLLPTGWRANNNGLYENLTYMAYLWSATSVDQQNSNVVLVGYDSPACYIVESHVLTGLPIRCLKDKTNSLPQLEENQQIYVYPNPANDEVQIQFNTTQYKLIKLIDLNGKCVYNSSTQHTSGIIDLANIPSGTYFIQVQNENTNQYKKLIIQH